MEESFKWFPVDKQKSEGRTPRAFFREHLFNFNSL